MNRVRLALCVLMFCGLSVRGTAQEERATPVVTTAAPVEKVRFAGSPSAVQIRIEVRSAGGTLVYDSDWKDGNILDWLPQDSSGQPLGNGAYRLVMQSKNLAGETSEKEAALRVDTGGMAIEGQGSASPKITLTAHDGQMGQLITTSGDLSFRFGDFLNRKDTEAMRLTAGGELSVNGVIHAKGVMFPDGTILTTAAGLVASGVGDGGSVMRQRPNAPNTAGMSNRETELRQRILLLNPPAVSASRLTPRPNIGPANQFVVDSAGVHIGTTPAFGLSVAGNVSLSSNLNLPATSSASAGVIMQGLNTFAHSFGTNNTFLGPNAGNLTMGGTANTASGAYALFQDTYGSYNNAIGAAALQNNTTGNYNTADGDDALRTNSGGDSNTANGYQALYSNANGGVNTAVGWSALYSNLGSWNTAIGAGALHANTSGTYNTASGFEALYNNTGSNNTAIGAQAGYSLTTGSNNIDIWSAGIAGESSTIRIGGAQSRTFIDGIRGVTTGASDAIAVFIDINGQLGTAASSRRYKFDINSMDNSTDGLMRLHPVTFRYLAHGDNAPLQYGLIAEEVSEVYPEMVTRNKDGEVDTVMYQFLAPMLLNEVQKQHRQIEEQGAENATLRDQLQRLMQRVEQLEGKRISQ